MSCPPFFLCCPCGIGLVILQIDVPLPQAVHNAHNTGSSGLVYTEVMDWRQKACVYICQGFFCVLPICPVDFVSYHFSLCVIWTQRKWFLGILASASLPTVSRCLCSCLSADGFQVSVFLPLRWVCAPVFMVGTHAEVERRKGGRRIKPGTKCGENS